MLVSRSSTGTAMAALLAAFFSFQLWAADPAPADYRSQHFVLHTDLSADDAQALLDECEAMYGYLASYFNRRAPGLIECYVVDSLERWPENGLDPRGRQAVELGAGTTLTHTVRSRGTFRATSVVYAAAVSGSAKHEVVYAFCRHAFAEVGPLWYAEGMAEMGQYWKEGQLGVDCDEAIARHLRESEPRPLAEILAMDVRSGENYGWAWSLCHLLAGNPNYQERFSRWGQNVLARKPIKFEQTFGRQLEQIEFEHRLLLTHLARGYRVDLCAWDWETKFARPQTGAKLECEVVAARGWQATGWKLAAGDRLVYRASGSWQLAPGRRATAAGISGGQGRLTAVLLADGKLGEPFPLGQTGGVTVPAPGELFVRCGDAWNELSDNSGSIKLTLEMR